MRAVKGREAVLRVRVDDEDGTLTAADSTPTVVVTDGDGTVVSGVSAVESESTGVYKATVPPRTELDILTATWSVVISGVTRTVVEPIIVQAERYAPLWFLREDTELSTVTGATFMHLVDAVEDWFESALQFPAVETPLRKTFDAPGGKSLKVPGAPFPKSIIAVTEGETVMSQADIDDLSVVDGGFEFQYAGSHDIIYGCATRQWALGRKTVHITHGGPWDAVPNDLVRAVRTLARYVNRGSNYPERARMVQTDGAMITFSTPDAMRPTGLPDVDGVINRYRLPTVVG
jgi:hypothetical protein